MNGRMYGNQAAKAAVEIALHDLVGRAAARHMRVGGKVRSRSGARRHQQCRDRRRPAPPPR
jgi:L-alanine-DL-glutamate epimerase-like enolase superfamily enzyme